MRGTILAMAMMVTGAAMLPTGADAQSRWEDRYAPVLAGVTFARDLVSEA